MKIEIKHLENFPKKSPPQMTPHILPHISSVTLSVSGDSSPPLNVTNAIGASHNISASHKTSVTVPPRPYIGI